MLGESVRVCVCVYEVFAWLVCPNVTIIKHRLELLALGENTADKERAGESRNYGWNCFSSSMC